MKNDQEILAKMRCLKSKIEDWIMLVEEMGNQDAFTDRGIESIVEDAEKIGELHQNKFHQ